MLQQRHTMSRRFTKLATVALYLLVPPTAAISAGGEMPALEEIVVTATCRSERLEDVPISITALTQEQMDQKGLRHVDHIARLTPVPGQGRSCPTRRRAGWRWQLYFSS